MKVLNNKGRQFYVDFKKELNSEEVEKARFLFAPYGIFLDFQTKVWLWSYMAEVISSDKVRCAIRDRAEHRLNVFFEVLKENKNEEDKQ
jgi:hypothetical protein